MESETECRLTEDNRATSVLEGLRGDLKLIRMKKLQVVRTWVVKAQVARVPQWAQRNLVEGEEVFLDNLEREVVESLCRLGAWHTQEVPARIALAWPPATLTSYMPTEGISHIPEADEIDRCLILARPMLYVLNIASATDIDIFTGLYEHTTGRDDKRNGRISRILSCQPDSNWDVIRSITKRDWK